MALADRRILASGFPDTTSSPAASPSFSTKTFNVSSSTSLTSLASPNSGSAISAVLTNSTTTSPPSSSSSQLNEYQSKAGKFAADELNNQVNPNPLTPEKSLSPVELSPTLRSISPDSLMNPELLSRLSINPTSTNASSISNSFAYGAPKKPKTSSRAPIATGISTTIPVTGEKPKPEQKNDASLQDDVLYAIFLILYEKDPEGLGMTVKQICDTLVERHPEMANLSTKTSNLVSAKLNAYVKRVEKGDANLKYALSRDWADASPKRMVYVYRGLLTADFHVHVKSAMEDQKQQQAQQAQQQQAQQVQHPLLGHSANLQPQQLAQMIPNSADKTFGAFGASAASASPMPNAKPRRQTMFDLGVTKNTFLDTPIDKSNLFVPYSSAPVTASLSLPHVGDSESGSVSHKNSNGEDEDDEEANLHSVRHNLLEFNEHSDVDFEDFEVFDENDEDDDLMDIETFKTFNKATKRSKSLSYLTMGKKTRTLTAAAAAPRASKAPSTHSTNAAEAAAALHAAAIKAMLPYGSSSSSGNGTLTTSNSNSSSSSDLQAVKASSLQNKKWLNVVRSGFMTQDIGTPEDISLSDLDKFFA